MPEITGVREYPMRCPRCPILGIIPVPMGIGVPLCPKGGQREFVPRIPT